MTNNNPNPPPSGETTIDLVAGRHPSGELIIEKLLVHPQTDNGFLLLKSPVFVSGIACSDIIQPMSSPKGAFKVLQHGGNLCLRIFSKGDFSSEQLEPLEQALTSSIEKLGGDLDVKEARVLIYSIHVSCGFNTIEKLLDEALATYDDVVWYYGNVYDPESGEPLNWWQAILAPE